MSVELPNGWTITALDTATDIIRGVSYKKDDVKDTPDENYISILRANNIQDGKLILADLVYAPKENVKEHQIIKKGDIVVAMSSGSKKLVGKSGLAIEDINAAFGTFCGVLRPNNHLSSRFVGLFTRSKEYLDKVSSLSKGVNINNLKPSHFSEIDIPLPPLNEQIRIANKLDSLLAKVDVAQTRLEKIPTLLKRFRQSVLAAATSGQLTKEWRGNSEINWPKVTLKNVASGFNYGSSTKSQPEGQVPVLRMGNLQSGKLDWSNLVYTSDKDEIEKYLLEPGDVLFNRTNSPELVGKTSIYRGEQKSIFAGYLIRIKGTEKIHSEYLNIQLNSPDARDYCWQVKTDGVSQSNINAKKIQAYEFELPSMEEQKEIVRRIESLFALADNVEKQYTEAKKRTDRLTQSLLAKAFRGELVPQDLSDEPASELLKRIQADREVQKPAKESLRKKSAKKSTSLDKTSHPDVLKAPTRTASSKINGRQKNQTSVEEHILEKMNGIYKGEEVELSVLIDAIDYSYEELKKALFNLTKGDANTSIKPKAKLFWDGVYKISMVK